MALTRGDIVRLRRMEAAERRSSSPVLVHDPMNTLLTFMEETGIPGDKSIYCSPRSTRFRSVSSVDYWRTMVSDEEDKWDKAVEIDAGEVVSTVTWGTTPQDVARVDGYIPDPSLITACSHFSLGANGLSLRYKKITSSGAISPALPPASIDILHIVILASILIPRIVGPQYSMTSPVAAANPIFPMICSMRSFAEVPYGRVPVTWMRIFLNFWRRIVCVARTSDVPIPSAKFPKAPFVPVWESPQTSTVPGCEKPCSGPMT